MDLKEKKVLVFGSGISGEAAAELLFCKGADVVLYDGNEKLDAGGIKDEILKEAHGRAPAETHGTVSVVLGDFPGAGSDSDEPGGAYRSSGRGENES